MHAQPYFPEPIEVPRNVAGERHAARLSFVRAVMAGHALSVVAVGVVAVVFDPPWPFVAQAVAFVACLVALTIVRRVFSGRSFDGVLSFFLLLPTLVSLGCIIRSVAETGAPVWIVGASYLVASVYGAVCGRDFSFVGQFMVTLIATVVLLIALLATNVLTVPDAVLWGLTAMGYVLYFVYDLAALLSRRRLGEETASVADLYRDMLNFTTYSVRIYLHWKRFGPI